MKAHILPKHSIMLIILFGMFVNLNMFSQCTWSNLVYDDFEYSTSISTPGFLPGVAYSIPHPDTYASHSPSQSVYINFVDSNSTSQPGVPAGTLFFTRTYTVCPNTPYKVSSWFCTTFAGLQCNLKIRVKDGNGAILNAANNFPCAYAPTFSQYSSGIITPTTSTMVLELITNVGGGGGNDLGMDDLLVEQCLSSLGSVSTQTTLCSASPTLNLFDLLGSSQPTYGSWTGPSSLTGSHLGTYNPGLNVQGNYIYNYYYQNNSNCPLIKDTAKVTVIPSPTITVNQATICAGQQTATLTAGGAANYTWTPITGLNAVTGSPVSAAPFATTVYTITGNFGTCFSTQTTTVTVIPIPVITVNSENICSGQSVFLNASGASSYAWLPSAGLNSTSTPTVQASPLSTIIYTVTGSSSGCSSTQTATVSILPSASAAISASHFSITSSEPVSTLTASGGNTFNWIFQNNTSAVLNVSPQKTTLYCVEVSENGLCPDTACVTIFAEFKSELAFPNVFTPNGDGDNERFFFPYSNLESFHVAIFNRWGIQVFESSAPDKNSGWDGKVNGVNASDGVYSYILRAKGLDDTLYEKAGYLTLMR
jgi:gliding motility-associated-like protein